MNDWLLHTALFVETLSLSKSECLLLDAYSPFSSLAFVNTRSIASMSKLSFALSDGNRFVALRKSCFFSVAKSEEVKHGQRNVQSKLL